MGRTAARDLSNLDPLIKLMEYFEQYLPNVSSIYGIMFYSFISYWLIFGLSILMNKFIFERKSTDNQKKIIKARDLKKKEADKLLKKIEKAT
jgi:hypothetical protein